MTTKKLLKRALMMGDILRWACAFREACGQWPTKSSGGIAAAKFETWAAVDAALRDGTRGLTGGSSLAQLLAEKFGARNIHDLPKLTTERILQWADQYHQATGHWPTNDSGSIANSGHETWRRVDNALRNGSRGFQRGSSLAKLLAEHRGVRNRKGLSPYTEGAILAWADGHYQRENKWPGSKSGPITDAPGETWLAVDVALRHGRRGLPGGSSLAILLAEKRQVRNVWSRPNLTIDQIARWADEHYQQTGDWPHAESGQIPNSNGETWTAINHALSRGSRGLLPGSSLAELLEIERGVRNPANLPKFTRKDILNWADAHRNRTGQLPKNLDGDILEAPGETWSRVDTALQNGLRGFRGGSSLAQFLAKYRGKRYNYGLAPLSQKKLLQWADAHYERTGKWPNVNSGPVFGAKGEQWDLIDNALRVGHRGLPGGSSLLRLLVKKRGVRNPLSLPPLTEDRVLDWAKKHIEQTGRKPAYKSGSIAAAAGETWAGVDWALRFGKRGFPGGSSLAKLLKVLEAPNLLPTLPYPPEHS